VFEIENELHRVKGEAVRSATQVKQLQTQLESPETGYASRVLLTLDYALC